MKKYLFIICTSISMLNISAQQLVYENYYKADSLLKNIAKNYQEINKLTYSGVNSAMGHYDTPEKQKSYPIVYRLAQLDNKFTIAKDLNYNGKIYSSTMTFKDDSCAFTDFGEKEIQNVPLKGKEFSYFYLPRNVVTMIKENKSSLHLTPVNAENYGLGFNNSFGNKFYLSVNKKTNLINKIIQLKYDDLYGDSYKEISYSEYKNNLPYHITGYDNQNLTTELHLDAVTLEKNASTKNSMVENIAIESLAKGLFLLKLKDYDNKVLVTEHKDFLAVYEAPINVNVGNEIISFLKKQFKNKPIKHCFLSHHHPDHAGAISAFTNINARIITTKGNVNYFNKLSKSMHTLNGKNFPPSTDNNAYLIIDALSKETFFKKSSTSVVVYESGATTEHTNEFLYFYFPKQKILFVGDLVLFPKEKIRDQNKRALSVYKLIKSKKIKVEKIYTSWPLKNQKEFGTMTDLKNVLLKSYPDLK
jgi:hypothetical protein